MAKIRSVFAEDFFARYQLSMFFLLSYLLSWWSAPMMNGAIIPYGPMFAALIVLALVAGRPGLSAWRRRMTYWRVSWFWYLVSPAIVIGYQMAAYLILLGSGFPVASAPALPSLGVFLQLLFMGGQWEEPGWSAYALPLLLERYASRKNGTLKAVMILGVFRAIWHLPLFIYGHIQWFDIFIFAIAFQIIIAWLYLRSGGSIPVVMLFHFTSNLFGAVMYPVFDGSAHTAYYALFMTIATLIAAVIAVSVRGAGSPHNLQAPKPGIEIGG